ncbi:MAG: hypothetical protein IJW25_03240, partial [Clostridia bacterium]|nr:hypothetical protein [Clostridia bacterium]
MLKVKNCFLLIIFGALMVFVSAFCVFNTTKTKQTAFAETSYTLHNSWFEAFFNYTLINKNQIEVLRFEKLTSIPTGYDGQIEVETGIYASYKVLQSGYYDLVIWSDGEIFTSRDSYRLFSGDSWNNKNDVFSKLKTINLNNFNTTNATDMFEM